MHSPQVQAEYDAKALALALKRKEDTKKKGIADIIAAANAAEAEATRLAAVAAATVEPPPEVVKKKPKAPKKSQSKEEKEAAKEKRLLKLVGAVVVKCMSKYSGKMDTDVFKKYAKEVRTSLAFLLLSLAIFLTLLHS